MPSMKTRARPKQGYSMSTADRMKYREYKAALRRSDANYRARMGAIPRAMPATFVSRGPEIKAIDIAPADYPFRVPATNSTILINGVQTGAGFFNRVGSRIEMKNLHLRGFINNKATSVVAHGRLLVVYDRQPTGALPTISDILQTRDQTGTASTASDSEINLDNRDRFQIVRDMQFYLPPCTNTAGVLTNGPQFPGNDDQQLDINEFIKLKGLTTHYKSTSNPCTIADIATGALYACFVGNADNVWQASIGIRLRYKDS